MATITIKNIDRCISRLYKVSNVDLSEVVKKATVFVHGQAKTLSPVNTGTLAGSIHMEVNSSPKKIEGRVYTNLNYAPYVEFGTGIKGNGTYPSKDISLSYRSTPWIYTPDDGETYYYTQGQVAQPFMYPALKKSEKYIKTLISKGMNNEIKKACK